MMVTHPGSENASPSSAPATDASSLLGTILGAETPGEGPAARANHAAGMVNAAGPDRSAGGVGQGSLRKSNAQAGGRSSSPRLLVCMGSGGVGKTTVSGALAVACAARGWRTLCLTVDPSKRLATSLGLEAKHGVKHTVDPEIFASRGYPLRAELQAMIVESRAIFDAVVMRYAPSPERARTITEGRLYRHVVTHLAGMQEYIALEALYHAHEQADVDVVVLDTPPSANAVDFLKAPERLTAILSSPATKRLVDTALGTGQVFGRGAKFVLQGFAKFTGAGLLDELARFLADLNDLFGGFDTRARRVFEVLRHPDAWRCIVTRPTTSGAEEALQFAQHLRAQGMAANALLLNAMPWHPSEQSHATGEPWPQDWMTWLQDKGVAPHAIDGTARFEDTRRASQRVSQEVSRRLEASLGASMLPSQRAWLVGAEAAPPSAARRHDSDRAKGEALLLGLPSFPADTSEVGLLVAAARYLDTLSTA